MIVENLIRITPCRVEQVPELQAAAKEDGHAVVAPTWVVSKNKELVGYIGTVPSVLVWLNTKKVGGHSSLAVMQFYENILAGQGQQIIGVPCLSTSPLEPFLPRLGYIDTQHKFYLKNLCA